MLAGWSVTVKSGPSRESVDRNVAKMNLLDRSSESPRDRGDNLMGAGQYVEAIAAYERAVAADPSDTSAYYGLGNAQAALGRFDQASDSFGQVVTMQPDKASAHFNKGNADFARKLYQEALECFRRANEIDPRADYLNNVGTALASLHRYDDAIEAFRDAVRSEPDLVEAHVNLARALTVVGRLLEAIDVCHGALKDHPRSTKILRVLGECWVRAEVIPNAIACMEQALQLSPRDADLRIQLASLLNGAGRLTEASALYEAALRLAPKHAETHSNLGEMLRARGLLADAVARQREALELDPNMAAAHSNLLLTMLYQQEVSAERILRESRDWAQRHTAGIRQLPRPPMSGRGHRLRIGYVSGSFHNHPVGYFIEPVLRNHDRERFEVHCYASQEHEDDLTNRLRETVEFWVDVRDKDDAELAQLIRADRIDVLVDLSGHTAWNRLLAFAYKPAPVQVTWAAYAATTGLPEMDYFLADRWVIPEDEEGAYVESVWRLPRNYVCFATPDFALVPRASRHCDTVPITFGCFNNRAKITAEVVRIWSRILTEAPSARLFLKTRALDDDATRSELYDEFAHHGVSATRLRMEGHSDRQELLARYQEVDLCLDPFPFTGGVTTLESLWMGVPVLTLRGDRFVGHASESFLSAVGLEELVATSRAEYREIAVRLARDHARRERLRHGLRERMLASALCDYAEFTRDLESAFREMCSRLS